MEMVKYFEEMLKSLGETTNAQSSSAPATPASADSVEAEIPVPKRRKVDLVRLRASLYEKNKKASASLRVEHEQTIAEADKCVNEHADQRDELNHFFVILDLRMGLLKALLKEGAAVYGNFLTQHQDELNYQPVPVAQLKKTLVYPDLEPLAHTLLTKEKVEECEAIGEEFKNHLAVHNQIRNAVKTSTKDIQNTIKSMQKKAEAAAKKADKDKEVQENKQKASQDRKVRAATQLAQAPPVFSAEKGKFEKVLTFATVGDVSDECSDGEKPFLVSQFQELKALIGDNVSLRSQVANFGNQFLVSTVCKSTGRAQCPVMNDNLQKAVGAEFDRVTSKFAVPLKEGESADSKLLKSVLHVGLFGFAPDMDYSGLEDKGLAQVRFLHSGTRQVFLMKLSTFAKEVLESHPSNIADVVQSWKLVSTDKLEEKKVLDQVLCVTQPAGSVLYIPPAWLVTEKVENGVPVVGLRQSLLCKAHMEGVEAFHAITPLANPLKAVTKAALQFLS